MDNYQTVTNCWKLGEKLHEITIATSIIPRNFDLQRSAIHSWLKLGFKVLSVNSEKESAVIIENFPEVSVRVVNRTAEAFASKPYVFFDDIRHALLSESSEVLGIVNSDIFLLATPGFKEFISSAAKNGLLFGSRIDVDSLENLDGEKHIYGFDFFFFDRITLTQFPDSEFCLGVPWWDYWAPIVPILNGCRCIEVISPVAFHVKHDTRWNGNHFLDYGRRLALHLEKFNKYISSYSPADLNSSEKVSIFSYDVLTFILQNASAMVYPATMKQNVIVEVGRSQYLTMRKNVIDRDRLIFELRERINSVYDIDPCKELAVRLAAIQSSRSWQITKPLRWLGDLIRKL